MCTKILFLAVADYDYRGENVLLAVFRIPTNLREVRNVRASDHGNGNPATRCRPMNRAPILYPLSSLDPAGDGQDVPPRLLPVLRVQRVPRRRPLHRRLRQQDLLRQRLSQDLRAQVRRLQRGHHSRRGANDFFLDPLVPMFTSSRNLPFRGPRRRFEWWRWKRTFTSTVTSAK